MFAEVARLPHVASVTQPLRAAPSGARTISADGKIAFATVVFDEKANLLPKSAAERVVRVARAAGRPGLQVELGGQAIEATEQQRLRPLHRRGAGWRRSSCCCSRSAR